MVCISCIFIPIGIWIWFNFIMPIVSRVKSYILPSSQLKKDETSNSSNDSNSTGTIDQTTNLKCPFRKEENQESKKLS